MKRQIADLRGLSRLAVAATLGMTDLVEAMHATIARAPGPPGSQIQTTTHGITGLVYASIRAITHLAGSGANALLTELLPLLDDRQGDPEREDLLTALNGILGDYLVATANPLAIPMQLRRDGRALELTRPSLAGAVPQPGGKILLLVHGLCIGDLHWQRNDHDHGARLAADLGYTSVYLHYNSGLHVSTNGRALADQIEALLQAWPAPVEELAIIGYSMGGLVARSAWHYGAQAGHDWLDHLRDLVFIGVPHHGAPLERGGNWLHLLLGISPYTAALTRLASIRSAGITDLRYGSLLDEDWSGRDRFMHTGDQRRPVALPDGVRCYTIAATMGHYAGDLRDQLLGDGLVPLSSALGLHHDPHLSLPIPESRRWIGYAMNHLDLLDHSEVYEQIRQWLGG